jgi:hypothetical protein
MLVLASLKIVICVDLAFVYSNNINNYMFPVRRLGVYLDHPVNSLCPCFPSFARQPPIVYVITYY